MIFSNFFINFLLIFIPFFFLFFYAFFFAVAGEDRGPRLASPEPPARRLRPDMGEASLASRR